MPMTHAAFPDRRRALAAASLLLALTAYPTAATANAPPATIAASTATSATATRTSARVTATEKIEHWATPTVTVSIDDSIDAIAPTARTAIETALTTWLTDDGKMPALTFATTHAQTLGNGPDGINSVVAAPITISGHQDDLAITISYARDDTGAIVEADMIVNTRWSWADLDGSGALTATSIERARSSASAPLAACASPAPAPSSCGDRFDVQAILTHEAGHFFGLNENYITPTSTMFYCSNPCEVHKRAPLDVDRASLAAVYTDVIPAAPTGGACDVARVGVGVATRTRFVGSGLLLGVGLGAIVRSRKRASRSRVTIGVRRACA